MNTLQIILLTIVALVGCGIGYIIWKVIKAKVNKLIRSMYDNDNF